MRIEDEYQLWFDALLMGNRLARGDEERFYSDWMDEITDFASKGDVLHFSSDRS